MGVLFDYFRAEDVQAVAHVMKRARGGPVVRSRDGLPLADAVDAKGIDPFVALSTLVALIRAVPWSPDLVPSSEVWPRTDGFSKTGPRVLDLDDAARDALAGLDDDELAAVALRWANTAQMSHWSAEDVVPMTAELVGLARRARASGDRLFCWVAL
jgi:hypothetical protein